MRSTLLTSLMRQAPYQPATNYWRAVETQEVIRYGLPPGRGLDLGCGDGHLMVIILDHIGPRDLLGLDIDPQETEMARARNVYREVVTAPGDHMPFPNGHFDYVFSNSVLEHIENIDGVLVEVARVLRPGGRFIFTVPGPNFHNCLRGPNFGDRDAYLRTVDARCAHLRYWDVTRWAEHLEKAGLALVHEHEYLTQAQVQRWECIARYTSGVLHRLVRQKRQPIEIQRLLRIRSPRFRLPKLLASLLANLIDFGARAEGSCLGCLLIEARRQ